MQAESTSERVEVPPIPAAECIATGRSRPALHRGVNVRFGRGEAIRKRTIDSLRQVLEAAGVEFTNGRKPGVRISMR